MQVEKYCFVPMNQQYAKEMIAYWKYEGIYAFHDYANEADHILETAGWGKGLFAALDEEEVLVGELTIDFFTEAGDPIAYDQWTDKRLSRAEMWIGFGLKPSLTGQGLGENFSRACIAFAMKQYNYHGEYIKLGVPAFNKRALKVYERIGFEEFEREFVEQENRQLEVIRMRKKLQN